MAHMLLDEVQMHSLFPEMTAVLPWGRAGGAMPRFGALPCQCVIIVVYSDCEPCEQAHLFRAHLFMSVYFRTPSEFP